MRSFIFAALILITGPALAQTASPVQQDAMSVETSLRHLFEDMVQMQQQYAEAQKTVAALAAKVKWWEDPKNRAWVDHHH